MAGEDLFHQSRTRARQPYDENRCRIRFPAARAIGKEFLAEEGANARCTAFKVLDVEWRIEPPQCVAASVVGKGVGVLLALFKGLAEREI